MYAMMIMCVGVGGGGGGGGGVLGSREIGEIGEGGHDLNNGPRSHTHIHTYTHTHVRLRVNITQQGDEWIDGQVRAFKRERERASEQNAPARGSRGSRRAPPA